MPPTCQNTVCLCQVKFETCYWNTHRNFSLYSFLCSFLRKSGSGKSHDYQTFLGEYSIQVYLHMANLNYASKIQTRKWIRRHFLVCFLFFSGNFFGAIGRKLFMFSMETRGNYLLFCLWAIASCWCKFNELCMRSRVGWVG